MTNAASILPGIPLVESPLFPRLLAEGAFGRWSTVAEALHRDGLAVVDLGVDHVAARAEAIIRALAPRFDLDLWRTGVHVPHLRVQDAWRDVPEVRSLALDAELLDALATLYGRAPFAFQTLHFAVGSEQQVHSDAVHFQSDPANFMCGVWVPLEDVHDDAGPLVYYPGSHTLPVLQPSDVGHAGGKGVKHEQWIFHDVWGAMIEAGGFERRTITPRLGQALIWSANLIHGGAKVNDRSRSRWSQVTHCFFDECVYYTPLHSEWPRGHVAWREPFDVATGQMRRRPRVRRFGRFW
jgi:hypothetical protein